MVYRQALVRICSLLALLQPIDLGAVDLKPYQVGADAEIPVYNTNQINNGTQPLYYLRGSHIVPTGKISGDFLTFGDSKTKFYAKISNKNEVRSVGAGQSIPLYLNGPEGTPFTLTSEPGKSWKDCKVNPSFCRAWPLAGASSKLTLKDSAVVTYEDAILGETTTQYFYKVDVEYQPKGGGQTVFAKDLWINSKDVRANPLPAITRKIEEPCPPGKPPKSLPQQVQEIIRFTEQINENFIQKIEPLMGQCLRQRARHGETLTQSVGRYWRNPANHSKIPAPMTPKQMEAIDALARTLYGEMRGCFQNGLQYPKAVASIVLLRAKYASQKGNRASLPFVSANASEMRGKDLIEIVPEVLASPMQFSIWNNNDGNLSKVQCPKAKMTEEQKRIWRQSIVVASEAIMAPTDFLDETKRVKVFHYTSSIPLPRKHYKEISASIEGMPLDTPACIRLWSTPQSVAFNK